MKKLVKNRIKMVILAGIFLVLPFQCVLASEITPSRVIQLVNEDRRKNGLALFAENKLLNQAAQGKVDDMLAHNYFMHTSPSGITPWHWLDQVRYDYVHAGENLAINFESAEIQEEAWMKSPTHRKNILNVGYQEIGVAIGRGVIDGQEGIVVVQFFGAQKFPDGSAYQKVLPGIIKDISAENKANAAPIVAGTEILKPFDKNIYKPYSFFTSFSYSVRNEFFSGERSKERMAWLLAMAAIFSVVVFNAVILSRKNHHNPFAAANLVVFMIMFTTLLFWGI